MRIQPLLLLAALPLSLANTCIGLFCDRPGPNVVEHQKRADTTSLENVEKMGGSKPGFWENMSGRQDWIKTGLGAVKYYRRAVEGQAGPEKQENPVVEAEEKETWGMRNGNRTTENKDLGNLGKRMIAEDNPICQVFFWDGRQGGCTFLTGSMATGICRMKADRIGNWLDWKDGMCAEVVVGHRSDDVSGVWGGCEIRRAWEITDCRTH